MARRLRRARLGGVVASSTVSERPMRVVAFSSASSTCSAWMAMVSSVTFAVTEGLPSRSPPTQLPNLRNDAAHPRSGSSDEKIARSNSRQTSGTMLNSVSSKTAISALTSSSGCSSVDRSCPVRQRMSISSSSRRVESLRSVAEADSSFTRSSWTATRLIAVTTARRRASVGCAVNTGFTLSFFSIWSKPRPCVSRRTSFMVAASDSGSGSGPWSRSRSARTRWCSSARFARWKYRSTTTPPGLRPCVHPRPSGARR